MGVRLPPFERVGVGSLGMFLQQPWSVATEQLEKCSNYAVALLRGCWRKFTEASVNRQNRKTGPALRLPGSAVMWLRCRLQSLPEAQSAPSEAYGIGTYRSENGRKNGYYDFDNGLPGLLVVVCLHDSLLF